MALFSRISGLSLPIPSSNGSNSFNVAEAMALGDFNGDGLVDLGIAPSDYNAGVPLPIKIFLNQGGGVIADKTTSVFPSGNIPTTGYTNFPALVRDFNGDGLSDLLLIDQGLETGGNSESYPGARNKLLVGMAGGTMKDFSSEALFAAPAFNHNASAGDVDGDGDIDVMISGLNGPQHDPRAGLLMLNDGSGHFTDGSSRLPPEAVLAWDPSTSQQFSQGSNLLVDLDGDSRLDLVLGRYVTSSTGVPLVRVYHQEAAGNFTRAVQIAEPVGLARLPYKVGSSQIAAGDLDSDGDMDLLFFLENNMGQGQALMILRNDGGFKFTDVTRDWLGDYTPPSHNLAGVQLVDVNGDGRLDLYLVGYAAPLEEFGYRILLNQGSGKLALSPGLLPGGPGLFVGLFGDINGDTRPDLVGLSFEGSTATPTSFVQVKRGAASVSDFNNDGTSDILFINSVTHDADSWKISNGKWAGSVDFGSHPGAGWQVGGIGDFNSDGTQDVLWFDQASGQTDTWLLKNGQWSASVSFGTHPGNSVVAGVGDFNNDGNSDVLWFDQSTGKVDEWKIGANGKWAGSVDIGAHPGSGWKIGAIGDFNSDHTSDVLWVNNATGETDIWKLMNGNWAGSVSPGTHSNSSVVVGSGDFYENGTSDILWYNQSNGDLDLWKINNGQWAGSTDLGAHPGAGWRVTGTGDYNGDGSSDVLWSNSTSGQNDIWLIKDGHWTTSINPGTHAATDWVIPHQT